MHERRQHTTAHGTACAHDGRDSDSVATDLSSSKKKKKETPGIWGTKTIISNKFFSQLFTIEIIFEFSLKIC